MKTPNNIIIIWRTIEGYEPQPFHFFRADEIEKARAFAAYAIEKDNDDNTKAHYSINFYEKVLTSQTKYDKIKEPTKPETPTFLLHLNNNSCLFIWLALIYGSFIIESR